MNLFQKKSTYVLCVVLAAALLFTSGIVVGLRLAANAESVPYVSEVKKTSIDGVVLREAPNFCKLVFVFPEPIAPDFYVGYGMASGYDIYLGDDEQEEWDPLGIGVDRAMTLATAIREQVAGVTEDVYANGYELTVIFAESHLGRRDELIKDVEQVIEDFLNQTVAV